MKIAKHKMFCRPAPGIDLAYYKEHCSFSNWFRLYCESETACELHVDGCLASPVNAQAYWHIVRWLNGFMVGRTNLDHIKLCITDHGVSMYVDTISVAFITIVSFNLKHLVAKATSRRHLLAVNLRDSERGLRETTESCDGGKEIKRGTPKYGTIFAVQWLLQQSSPKQYIYCFL